MKDSRDRRSFARVPSLGEGCSAPNQVTAGRRSLPPRQGEIVTQSPAERTLQHGWAGFGGSWVRLRTSPIGQTPVCGPSVPGGDAGVPRLRTFRSGAGSGWSEADRPAGGDTLAEWGNGGLCLSYLPTNRMPSRAIILRVSIAGFPTVLRRLCLDRIASKR